MGCRCRRQPSMSQARTLQMRNVGATFVIARGEVDANQALPFFYAVPAPLMTGSHNFLRCFNRLVGANGDIG